MQTGNGSGVIGVNTGGGYVIWGVKYAVPNGNFGTVFWDPNSPITPQTLENGPHSVEFKPGIPTSPATLSDAATYAKSKFGAYPNESPMGTQVETY